MATQDDGRMEGDGQRDMVIIDATPTRDPNPGGASSQLTPQRVAAADDEDSSQRLTHRTGDTQRILSVPPRQLRRLVAGQPSPATCLVIQDARDYYADYNAAPRGPPPRSSPTTHVGLNTPRPRPNRPSAIVVLDESPLPPPVNSHSSGDFGLQHQSAPLQSQAVWTQSQYSSRDSQNLATSHRALLPKPKGNFGNFNSPAPRTVCPDLSNAHLPSFFQRPPCNESLPSFAELEAEVYWYTRERTTALPSIANDQPGPLDGLLTGSNRQDAADRTMLDQFLPRTINTGHENVSSSYLPSLRSDRLGQDATSMTRYRNDHRDFANSSSISHYNAANTRGNPLVQPDRQRIQENHTNTAGLMRSLPARALIDSRANGERITDERALEILESNSTIAEEFRRQCAMRLQQYQQSLDGAYNQRLAEIEDYTRDWRNHTSELWQAVRTGQFNPSHISKQSTTLAWQGPQEMAKTARFQLPSVDTRAGHPVLFSNGQARIGEPSSDVPSSGSPIPKAPGAPRILHREVKPDHRQLHRNDTCSHPTRPPQSGKSRCGTQARPVSSAVPVQALASRPAPSQLAPSQSDAFRTATSGPKTSQPDIRSGPARAETEARQLAHSQPAIQPTLNKPTLIQQDSIPTVAVRTPQRQLLGREWISDLEGYVQEPSGQFSRKSNRLLSFVCSSSLGSTFTSSLNLSYSAILLGVKSKSSGFDYVRFEHLPSTVHIAYPSEVVIDLSEANVLMFGKAFCYMKQRGDYLRSLVGLIRGRRLGNNEQSQRMYNFFSQQPINRALNTMRHPGNRQTRFPYRDPVHEARKLLIARPKHEDGHIKGAVYFDVGSEQPTIRADRDNSVILEEDGITFGRVMAMLDFCLESHIVVLPGAPLPTNLDEATTSSRDARIHLRGGAPQSPVVYLEPQVRWDRWVKVVQGTPSAYLRMEVNKSQSSFEMGSYRYPVIEAMANDLGIPTNRQIWFKSTILKDGAQYWNLESASMVASPVITGQDVMIPWREGNVLIFWKAFCLMKERMDRLAMLRAQEAGASADFVPPSSHERLARYYRDFLANKDRQTKLHTLSLAIYSRDKKGNTTFDISSRGWYVDRRLLIARVHPKESANDGTLPKFFDVGTVSSIQDKPHPPGDIIIPEHSAVASRIAALLISSMHMNMFPSLNGLGPPLSLHTDDTNRLARVDASTLPDTSAAPNTATAQAAAVNKRVVDLSTDERSAGSGAGSSPSLMASTNATFVPSAIHTQSSPSLRKAATHQIFNADVMEDTAQNMGVATSIQAKEVSMVEHSENESNDLMDFDGALNNLPIRLNKRPAPNADASSRSPKRVRPAMLEDGALEVTDQVNRLSLELAKSISPSQPQQTVQPAACSMPSDASVDPAMPEEMVTIPASTGADKDCSNSPSVLDDQSLADHTLSQSLNLPQKEVAPRAAADAAAVPSIVHRYNTLEPEETTALPFARNDQEQRAKSADVSEDWQPREDMAARSDSGSEAAESSYVTAAEMSDE